MHIATLAFFSFGGLTLDPGGCLSWAVAALIAGWLAGLLVRGRGFGCLGDIVLGLVGAFIGLFILSILPLAGMPSTLHFIGTFIVAFLGALILAAIGRLLGGSKRNTTRRYYDWHNNP